MYTLKRPNVTFYIFPLLCLFSLLYAWCSWKSSQNKYSFSLRSMNSNTDFPQGGINRKYVKISIFSARPCTFPPWLYGVQWSSTILMLLIEYTFLSCSWFTDKKVQILHVIFFCLALVGCEAGPQRDAHLFSWPVFSCFSSPLLLLGSPPGAGAGDSRATGPHLFLDQWMAWHV